MRHFAHHIGDYAAATAHLTFIEDAAYHRLLRLYYQNERPLPADEKLLFKLVRAASRSEKNAVRRILTEFFHLTPEDTWTQPRADRELAKFKDLVEAGREGGIKSGLARSLKQKRTTHYPLPINHTHGEISTVAEGPPAPEGAAPRTPGRTSAETWRQRLAGYDPHNIRKTWPATWGPRPDAPGDQPLIPPDLLRWWRVEREQDNPASTLKENAL